MFAAIRKFFARAFEPWPTAHRTLAVEAAAAARSEAQSTLIILAEASYLPHGGRDRVALRLRHGWGRVERTRTPHRGEPMHIARELTAEECTSVLDDLNAFDVWNLSDHREA